MHTVFYCRCLRGKGSYNICTLYTVFYCCCVRAKGSYNIGTLYKVFYCHCLRGKGLSSHTTTVKHCTMYIYCKILYLSNNDSKTLYTMYLYCKIVIFRHTLYNIFHMICALVDISWIVDLLTVFVRTFKRSTTQLISTNKNVQKVNNPTDINKQKRSKGQQSN
jgi:hypothetical protein